MARRNDFSRGYNDGKERKYRPPGGTGFLTQIQRQVQGPTDRQKSYDNGYGAGKRSRPRGY